MSIYTEISEKAADWAKRFSAHEDECALFAKEIGILYMRFLEAPQDKIKFYQLTQNLGETENYRDMDVLPKLVLGDNGYFYFGLKIIFSTTEKCSFKQWIAIGVKKGAYCWSIKWGNNSYDVPFLNPENNTSLHSIFREKVTDINNRHDSLIFSEKPQIGFVYDAEKHDP